MTSMFLELLLFFACIRGTTDWGGLNLTPLSCDSFSTYHYTYRTFHESYVTPEPGSPAW